MTLFNLFIFRCAITNCWAATVQNIADVSYGIAYDPTAGSVAKFYSGMCPVHPWVKPAFGNTVDTVNPANADQNLEVTLRQFKFSNTKDTDGFYYHCEVWVKSNIKKEFKFYLFMKKTI